MKWRFLGKTTTPPKLWRRFCGLFFLSCQLKTAGYFLCNIRELACKIGAGAKGCREPAVHGQISRGVARIYELGNVVAKAYINAKLDGLLKSDITYVPLAAAYIVCYLDSDSAVVVFGA